MLETSGILADRGRNHVTGSGESIVLVADDEPNIVEFLTDLLQDEGFRVIQAYDGLMALEKIDQLRPDLVIADVMMPKLDGLSLLRAVEERGEQIPFILMSAAVTPRTSTATFVPKPFDIDQMLQVVEGTITRPV